MVAEDKSEASEAVVEVVYTTAAQDIQAMAETE
jgi:hypothetical protein